MSQCSHKNTLYYGDNLDVLRRYIADQSVDLVYLDPPFNSNATYNVLFAEQNGSRAAAQIKAFKDTWRWDLGAEEAYRTTVESAPERVADVMTSFRDFLGESDMTAYLAMMAPRLLELRRVLKQTGSIYLHCDPTASHYLKILMDAVFGPEHFQREIIWRIGWVSGFKTQAQNWIRNHDVLLYYTKSGERIFNKPVIPYRPGYVRRNGSKPTGKGIPVEDTWNCHAEDVSPSGKPLDSVMIKSFSTEKLHYPTQKPEALLERIIQASSNEGDVVLDPFCGCGTTVVVAERLNRQWIGIDITQAGIVVIKKRLRDSFGSALKYQVVGEPTSIPDAQALAEQDPYQFQWWALGLVGARRAEVKKGADKGIDGRLYFHDEGERGKTKQVVFSVKAGHTNVAHVRDLRGVLERENAEIGVFITIQEPTRPMRTEAATAGFYDSPWGTRHPRLQILTVAELLKGARIDMPPSRDLRTLQESASRQGGEGKRVKEARAPTVACGRAGNQSRMSRQRQSKGLKHVSV